MSISLSDRAAERVRDFLQHEQGSALRVGVKRTGCSGWAYVVNITADIADDDHRFDDHDIAIVVDPKSLPLVDGTHIDFVMQGLNKNFVFENPNVTDECGCGESFTVNSTASSTTAPANPF